MQRPAPLENGLLLFDGKLALPPLPPNWVQESSSNGGSSEFKGGDLEILQRSMAGEWKSIEKSLPRTLEFNQQHPPNIWLMAEPDEQQRGWFQPYLQVSLISHADAENLMRSVKEDFEAAAERISSDLKEITRELDLKYVAQPRDDGDHGDDGDAGDKWGPFIKFVLRTQADWRKQGDARLHALLSATRSWAIP